MCDELTDKLAISISFANVINFTFQYINEHKHILMHLKMCQTYLLVLSYTSLGYQYFVDIIYFLKVITILFQGIYSSLNR